MVRSGGELESAIAASKVLDAGLCSCCSNFRFRQPKTGSRTSRDRGGSFICGTIINLKAAELILDVLLDVALLLRGGIDRAMGIDSNAFRRLQFRVGHGRRRDVGRDLPVFHAANADAHLAVAIVVLALRVVRGLGVDRIKHVVLIDPYGAWSAELLPRGDEFAVLVEYDDATVVAVRDEQPVLAVERDRVRLLQFAVAGTEFGERLDELPVLVELHDAGIAEFRRVPFGNEDVAITRDGDTGWLIECVQGGTARALPGLAERHQDLAIRAELGDLHALAIFGLTVDRPDIAILVRGYAVRKDEQARAKILHRLAVRTELENGRVF